MNVKEEIKEIFKNIEKEIQKRLREFSDVWDKGTKKELFIELVFCILTPQSKARNADKAIKKLLLNKKLFNGNVEEIAEELNIVRFKNNKSRYIIEAREKLYKNGKYILKDILIELKKPIEMREWLVKNIKGIGFKEASHFLRNVGFYKDIAILDRHILRNLVYLNVIEEVPKTLTKKKYLEIEEKMKKESDKLGISMEYLDLVLWYKEAGEIFK
ncbi:MAG: DNA lyase [Fusobacteriia bacterium 4572_132]|nr:MAG: DNA lyase [Fusobacteriia bacterium 4572_132]